MLKDPPLLPHPLAAHHTDYGQQARPKHSQSARLRNGARIVVDVVQQPTAHRLGKPEISTSVTLTRFRLNVCKSLNQRQGLGRRAIALEESCEGDIFRREGVIPTKCHLEIVQRKSSTSGLGNGHRIGVESVD
jgi:hypothetical protein